MADYDALELRLADGRWEHMRIPVGFDPDAWLERFLHEDLEHRRWIKLEDGTYIRSEQVTSVRVKRGVSDKEGPPGIG